MSTKSLPDESNLGVMPRYVLELPFPETRIVVSSGFITDFTGSAIVNAANPRMLGGGGVDGAISRAGGDALYKARQALPLQESPGAKPARCPTGKAVLTIGGDLPCPFCIHAVGPCYTHLSSLEEGDELLKSAYANSMAVAQGQSMTSVAFSLLSAGVYRGDRTLKEVLAIGVDEIVKAAYEGLEEVHLMAFLDKERDLLVELLADRSTS